MSEERAREIARYILNTLHPHMDINQIFEVVQQFDDHFPELIPVVVNVSQDYENQIKNVVIKHVENLLKQNKVNEASDLINKALNKN